MTIPAAGGGADRDEHHIRLRHAGLQIRGEGEAPGLHIILHQRRKAGFIDRDFAGLQGGDFALVLVHAGHVVSEVGKADARYQAHIAGADHHDAHMGTSDSRTGRTGGRKLGAFPDTAKCPRRLWRMAHPAPHHRPYAPFA